MKTVDGFGLRFLPRRMANDLSDAQPAVPGSGISQSNMSSSSTRSVSDCHVRFLTDELKQLIVSDALYGYGIQSKHTHTHTHTHNDDRLHYSGAVNTAKQLQLSTSGNTGTFGTVFAPAAE